MFPYLLLLAYFRKIQLIKYVAYISSYKFSRNGLTFSTPVRPVEIAGIFESGTHNYLKFYQFHLPCCQ